MTVPAAFLREAFNAIAHALADLGVDADLDLSPAVIAKSVRRRCTSGLRRLAVLIRRLIFLMALSLELSPATPRAGRNYFREDDAKPAPRKRSFRIVPVSSVVFTGSFGGASAVPQPGPVDAGPVIERWMSLLDALKHRERRAKLLARTLQRWKAKGERRPYVPPLTYRHRLPAQLGLIAGALTVQLNAAFEDWPDTG